MSRMGRRPQSRYTPCKRLTGMSKNVNPVGLHQAQPLHGSFSTGRCSRVMGQSIGKMA